MSLIEIHAWQAAGIAAQAVMDAPAWVYAYCACLGLAAWMGVQNER